MDQRLPHTDNIKFTMPGRMPSDGNPHPLSTGTSATGTPPSSLPPGSTYLAPEEAFPADLSSVPTDELHVFFSKVSRQLDQEYISGEGPHPETHERHAELNEELNTRDTERDA